MLSFRSVRRRGWGLFLKSILIVCLFVIFIQITSSHPRGVTYQQDEQVLEKVESYAHLPAEQKSIQHVDGKIEISQVQHVEKKLKKPRENEFYENVIVHFDLKGAPPKVPYFKQLLNLVAKAGATGVLIEWEDMFPWKGKLEIAKSTDAYSLNDVREILSEATTLGLDIIPLVQTFGHLEWVLKLDEYKHLRENEAYPQVLCLGDEEGVDIVKDALRQVIEVHSEYGIPYFHIGADEAFEFGVCPKSQQWISKHGSDGGRQTLALSHLKTIAQHVKSLTNTTVLAWHDMLKDFDGRLIKKLELFKFIQPVVWDYSENIVTMNDWSFSTLADNFPIIWASSAYKGANFPSAKYIDIRHYETNNRAWINTKQTQQRKFRKFGGIIITGWQRYDHMAALCEILPMGTPSMVLQIQIALLGSTGNTNMARTKAAQILGCSGFDVHELNIISNSCNFPGSLVYMLFQGTARQTIDHVEGELGRNHHIMGWLSPYSMRHNYSQNWYLKQIEPTVSNLFSQLQNVEDNLRREMSKLFFDNTIDEFLYITMGPTTDKMKNMVSETKRLQRLRVYPKRHFPIVRKVEL
ncbi:unnamed protein product [Auanema sp. JU1783]|nr:unnamed protein product [Auanema sp. JU1783]